MVPWLIWTTYNPFSKISENKMGNRSEILLYILHFKISENAKHATAQNFTWPRITLRGRVTYLIKSKLIDFKLIIDRKLR